MLKKKLLIVTSDGGGGQTSITKALEESLAQDYTIISRRAFTDILKQIDPIQKLTFGKFVAEDMYNTISTYKALWGLHRFVYKMGSWYYRLFFKLIEKHFYTFLNEEQIDGVISIIPIINQPILRACEKKEIPLLIFSPDINPAMYLEYMKNLYPKTPCALAVPFNHPHIQALAHKKHLPLGFIHAIGFPLRKEFLSNKSKNELKKEYGIEPDKPVILVLLGSLGSPNLTTIAKHISHIKHSAHIILCTGRYEAVKKNLERMLFPSHLTRTIVGYTDKMNDYMRMSDMFFTKSGSVSVGEALYLGIPLLLDATGNIFPWEKFNHGFIKEKNFGKSITTYEAIPHTIDKLLDNNGHRLAIIKKQLAQLPLKNGNLELKILLDQLFLQNTASHLPLVISLATPKKRA